MAELAVAVKPGIKTQELEEKARGLIKRHNVMSSFLNYRNYPAVLCASINDQIVHIVPSDRILKDGDILSLDMGINYNGWHTDMAVTIPVGEVPPEIKRLIKITKKALKRGIKKARAGNTIGDIGNTIERYVKSQGFNIIKDLCGHGIGKTVHEKPDILNYGKRGKGEKLREGQMICIEPMVSMGSHEVIRDGYGYKTKDGSLSAHFEHTILIQKSGAKILTQ